MNRRVVVTGMGTVNPVANNLADFEKNLYAGVSGGNMITSFDTSEYSCSLSTLTTTLAAPEISAWA